MRVITLNENNVVITVVDKVGSDLIEGEIQSDTGNCGDIMQTDGTFVTPEMAASTSSTLEELKDNQLILMDALATIFETMIGGV